MVRQSKSKLPRPIRLVTTADYKVVPGNDLSFKIMQKDIVKTSFASSQFI